MVVDASYLGSDETTTNVAGKKFWQWVWQSPLASYFVIDKRRGYDVVKEHFTENYRGVIGHDCWCAQNKTPAGAHQLCHAHLLRNLGVTSLTQSDPSGPINCNGYYGKANEPGIRFGRPGFLPSSEKPSSSITRMRWMH
jgi:Transposase IS66 family